MRAYRRKLRRRRYERTCTCEGSRTLTAPPPPKLIPKGWYGISLWVEMLLDKYFTYRPTERLLASWRLLGLDLAAGTVTDGLQRLENPTPADLRGDQAAESSRGFASRRRDTVADLRPPGRQGGIRLVVLADQEPGRGSRDTILDSDAGFRAGWPQGIAPLGLPQIRTCTFAHTAPHIMNSLRDGSLSESALRLVPDSATVVVSCTRFRVSMHPPCFPPTVS